MSLENPFLEFNFNDAEENLYKLIIQLSKIPRPESRSIFNKLKATDLIEVSKYSKPKVYDVIKRLTAKNLIEIDNTRPLFIVTTPSLSPPKMQPVTSVTRARKRLPMGHR